MTSSAKLIKAHDRHPFVTWKSIDLGGDRQRFDYDFAVVAFTNAVAKELGATADATQGHANGYVDLDGIRIRLTPQIGAKMGRVEVGGSIPSESSLRWEQQSKVPSITLDASKGLDKIAADILRKIVRPLDDQRATGAATVKAEAERKQAFRDYLAGLGKTFPGLRIDEPHSDHYEASFTTDSNVFGAYVRGRIGTGSIRFEHMSVSESQFTAVLAALRDNHTAA